MVTINVLYELQRKREIGLRRGLRQLTDSEFARGTRRERERLSTKPGVKISLQFGSSDVVRSES